jgi:hypothetical protein
MRGAGAQPIAVALPHAGLAGDRVVHLLAQGGWPTATSVSGRCALTAGPKL